MADLFDYPVPPLWELREMYDTPYRFSDDVTRKADLLFKHPQVNKWNELYGVVEHQAQFGGAVENCADSMLVRMWKNFLGLNKKLRGQVYSRYYPTPVAKMIVKSGGFLDAMIAEIDAGSMIMQGDDMLIRREGIALRGKRSDDGYSDKQMEYLCGLE